MHEMHGVI